ncbi:MAG: hypothetical protein IKO35_02930 [Elusimicrobiaceae bacterium]|nr:hypothetical protein [Elusimicrobiaceae bacterium]
MQYAFDTFHPQIALVEFEPGREWEPCLAGEATYTAALAAKNNVPLVRADADLDWQWEFAHQHGFSYEDWQMMWIIRNAYYGAREGYKTNAAWEIQAYARREHDPAKGSLFTEETLLQYFQQYYGQDFNTTDFVKLFQDLQNIYPTQEISQTPFYRLSDITGRARSAFMIQNIAEALNQYDIVFIEMGSGHHVDMLRALKKMLGKPRYITAEQIPPQTLWEQCSLEGLEEKILIN